MRSLRRYRPRSISKKVSGYTFDWFGNNRTVCDCLSDMRKLLETHNFSPLAGLIEEVQVMANRMEAALSDKKDLLKLSSELSKARKAYKQLQCEYEALDTKAKLLRPEDKVKS